MIAISSMMRTLTTISHMYHLQLNGATTTNSLRLISTITINPPTLIIEKKNPLHT